MLTHRSAPRSSSGPWDLLPIAVHTPAVSRAAVTLGGFIGSMGIAGGDVLARDRAWPSGAKLSRAQKSVSVGLTLGFCPLCRKRINKSDTCVFKCRTELIQ